MKSLLSSPESRLFGRNVVRDFLVVVGGILIALWAEDQWQTRVDSQYGQSALTRIANDLVQDIEDISGNLDRARVGLNAARWISKNRDTVLVDSEELRRAVFGLSHCSVLNVNSSEYSALRNSGTLHLIEDKDLLNAITSLYEGRALLERLHELDCERSYEVIRLAMPYAEYSIPPPVRPGNNPNWDMWSEATIDAIVDSDGMFNDRVFINSVMALAAYRQFLIRYAEKAIDQAESLRDEILAANRD
jgi:hypothetical protein